MVSAMTRQQTYPLPSRTRAVYPPLAITRQSLITPNIIMWEHNYWYQYIESPGNYRYVVDNLRTEYIYVWIWSSHSSIIVLSNPVLGRVMISVESGEYRNVFRTGGQPINVEVAFTSGVFYIYLSEGILVTGDTEVIRFRPSACREFVTIYGADVIARCTLCLLLGIYAYTGDVEYYVNGVYYDREYLYEIFTLDREIVVTARGNGFIAMFYMIYPESIVLDVDTAYIVPCPHNCYVYEDDIDYYDTPCIYRNPTIELEFYPRRLGEVESPQILVLEIDDQSKEYIDIDRIRDEVCGRWPRYPRSR